MKANSNKLNTKSSYPASSSATNSPYHDTNNLHIPRRQFKSNARHPFRSSTRRIDIQRSPSIQKTASSNAWNRRNMAIRPSSTIAIQPSMPTDISSGYSYIQSTLTDPTNAFKTSKYHVARYKQIEYRKLFKDWCRYHEKDDVKKGLTIFHDYFTNLQNNVYPFTLLKDNFEASMKRGSDSKRKPSTRRSADLLQEIEKRHSRASQIGPRINSIAAAKKRYSQPVGASRKSYMAFIGSDANAKKTALL